MFKNSPFICYIFFAVDDVIVTSGNDVNTLMIGISTDQIFDQINAWSILCEKIRNIEQSDCLKCFLTNTGVLVNWNHCSKNWQYRYCCSTYWVVVDLALSAQYSTCVVSFLISTFSLPRLHFLLGNTLSKRFAPYLLFLQIFHHILIFSANSHHWRMGINWHHNYVINSKEYVTNRWTVFKHS